MNKVVLFNNCTKKVLILICLMMIFSLFSCSNVLLDNDLSQSQDEVLVTFSINSAIKTLSALLSKFSLSKYFSIPYYC